MANDVENNNNKALDEDNINIDDIEGLERDLPSEEKSTDAAMPNNESLDVEEANLKGESEQNEPDQHAIDKLKDNKKFKIILLVLIILIFMIIGLILFSTKKEKVEVKPPVENTTAKELPPIETYQFKRDTLM